MDPGTSKRATVRCVHDKAQIRCDGWQREPLVLRLSEAGWGRAQELSLEGILKSPDLADENTGYLVKFEL